MRPAKIALLVAGVLATLVAFGMTAAGGTLVWAHATQRDDAGFYATGPERFETPTAALASERIDLGTRARGGDWLPFAVGTARITVQAADGRPVFVGIGPGDDVARYLAGTAHDEVTSVSFGPFEARYRRHPGQPTVAEPPAVQPFWMASATGPGQQQVVWEIEAGEWGVVVMNADGSPGVAADLAVGIRTGVLLPVGLAILALGLVVGGLAVLFLVLAVRPDRDRDRDRPEPAAADRPVPAAAAADRPPADPARAYPLRIEGALDPDLNRALWLVKWLLAIPHAVVLFFLWVAFAVLTFAAGVAVLVTGRYPVGIFEFNVGVLRWTWRVTFYALTLGTDRYPPFSLQPDPGYPADLAVEYPERLSRPLVLVKWWLLAIPHYLIVAVFGGGSVWWGWSWFRDDVPAGAGFGLIGILALVAGVTLAFTGRYPRSVFDFIMGMQRWTYRVWAYAALMRDEYPPFRLDTGGADPGAP
jgi:hypothetical protein